MSLNACLETYDQSVHERAAIRASALAGEDPSLKSPLTELYRMKYAAEENCGMQYPPEVARTIYDQMNAVLLIVGDR